VDEPLIEPPPPSLGSPPLSMPPRAANEAAGPRFIARWDLDKTYLRTNFDTVRDLVRTAIERPDQKRTVPGAAALLRELGRAGAEIHILSGSPEQLRSRIEDKLRLDGARYSSLTLKPNLTNILRFRFRALRGQLGYKLPTLLLRRAELRAQHDALGRPLREVLLGDDAEADAFVYSLFADICAGRVNEGELAEIMRLGQAYDDTIEDALRFARYVQCGPVVDRILIHLDRQSSPSDFRMYGPRVVPFYNYLQAAFVLHDRAFLGSRSVLRIAENLVAAHNFDGATLARGYEDLARRGHVSGRGRAALEEALAEGSAERRAPWSPEILRLVSALGSAVAEVREPPTQEPIDYLSLVASHNPRRR
jgi:hypothetical protein